MSFELILMRHAKSDWADETLSDHDRPLNERGCRDAPRIGHWFSQQNLTPDLIHCSTAVRVQQTVRLLSTQLPAEPQKRDDSDLYLASPSTMLEVVANYSGEARRVMVVAHNPGLGMLAAHFSPECSSFPTAAVVVLKLDIESWTELTPDSTATLVATTRPKEMDD